LEFSWSKWLLAYDHPSKVEAKEVLASTHLAPAIKNGMDKTQEDLIIVSPYFVPGVDFTAYLTAMVEKGVRVRILTNSLSANDVSLVHAGYMRYRKELVAGGVELYEYKALDNEVAVKKGKNKIGASRASLHAKFFGFDQRYIFIGSFNLDARSVALNTELGAYFNSAPLARELSENFDANMLDAAYRLQLDDNGNLVWITRKNGEEVRFNKEPETGFWKRFNTRFLSIFVPESML
jgi:putative cardiolipin synthase